jgi:hypothetical protein
MRWRTSAFGQGGVKSEIDSSLATPDLSERPLRRFLKVGNGKETPEITRISRFYTAWAKSRH